MGNYRKTERRLVPKRNYIDRHRDGVIATLFVLYVAVTVAFLMVVGTTAAVILVGYHVVSFLIISALPDEFELSLISIIIVGGLVLAEMLMAVATAYVAGHILSVFVGKYEEVGLIADRKKKIKQIKRKRLYKRLLWG